MEEHDEGNPIRGLFYGILFSIPIWALIIWGAVWLVTNWGG